MSCLSVFSMALLCRIVSRLASRRGAVFAVFLWSLSPFMIKTELNGLETGLTAFLLLFAFDFYLRKIRVPGTGGTKYFLLLGGLLGLGILSRIDTGFFALALGLDYLWFSKGRRAAALKQMVLAAGITFLIAAPWFIYGLVLTGHPLPVSGRAVNFLARVYGYHAFGSDYLHVGNPPGFPHVLPADYYGLNFLYAFKAMLLPQPLLKIFPWGLWGKAAGALALIGLAFAVRGRGGQETGFSRLRAPGLFLGFLTAAYALIIFGQWFFQRYFFPAAVFGVAAGGLLYACAAEHRGARLTLSKKIGAAAAGLVCFLLLIIFASGIKRQFFPGKPLPPARYHGMAVWTAENTEKDAVIGAFQAGMMAYFTPRRVICLDGVVNAEALEALRAGAIDRYILDKGIDYLMDWDWVLADLYAGRASSADPYQHLTLVRDGYFRVYRVKHAEK
jgi:hypothetical protein